MIIKKQKNLKDNSMPSQKINLTETNDQELSFRKQQMDNHQNGRFSQKLLNIGFVLALLMTVGCLAGGALYFYDFSKDNINAINEIIDKLKKENLDMAKFAIGSRVTITRIQFLSCGMFIGMIFGFLGFALFLLGIKGEMNIDANSKSYKVTFVRMSPGIFVIFCATILIAMCVTNQIPFNYELENEKIKEKNTFTPPTMLLPLIGDDLKP